MGSDPPQIGENIDVAEFARIQTRASGRSSCNASEFWRIQLRGIASSSCWLIWTIAFAGLLLGGCSRPPAVEFENLHLISSLRTACSAENSEWLEGVARAVDKRHADGRMSDTEREHFLELIETARSGDWESAEVACLKFEKAQLGRTRERPADEHGHSHEHDHSHP